MDRILGVGWSGEQTARAIRDITRKSDHPWILSVSVDPTAQQIDEHLFNGKIEKGELVHPWVLHDAWFPNESSENRPIITAPETSELGPTDIADYIQSYLTNERARTEFVEQLCVLATKSEMIDIPEMNIRITRLRHSMQLAAGARGSWLRKRLAGDQEKSTWREALRSAAHEAIRIAGNVRFAK